METEKRSFGCAFFVAETLMSQTRIGAMLRDRVDRQSPIVPDTPEGTLSELLKIQQF
jgi:hypothetical protein